MPEFVKHQTKKPPGKVTAIHGAFAADIVTESDLKYVSELQAAAWRAEKDAQEATLLIESRILHGAIVEDCNLHFDSELRMVRTRKGYRSRKAKTAGGTG